jgi:S1-C subfamily serine protease
MMEFLGKHEPNDVVELGIERDGAEITLKATLQPVQPQG